MNKALTITIIAVILLVLGIGIFSLLSNSSSSGSSASYQTPSAAGSTQAAMYGSFNLTPTPSTTDNVPHSSTDISAP